MRTVIAPTSRAYYRNLGFVIAGQVRMMADRGYYMIEDDNEVGQRISDKEIMDIADRGEVDSTLFVRRAGGDDRTNLALDCNYINEHGHIILVRYLDDLIENKTGAIKKNNSEQIGTTLAIIYQQVQDIISMRQSDPEYDVLLDDTITGMHRFGDMTRYVSCILIGWANFSQNVIIDIIKRNSFNIEYFTQVDLIISPIRHVDYVPHTLLSLEDTEDIMHKLNVDVEQIPKIYNTERIVRHFGWQNNYGQLIRIEQRYHFQNSIVDEWINYRMIVRKDIQKK